MLVLFDQGTAVPIRSLVIYLLFELLCQLAAAQVVPTKPNPTSTPTDQAAASLRFVAVDREGKPADSLAAEELSLWVGGEPRKILSVSRASNEPRTFGLFFDVSGSRRADALIPQELWATAKFLESVWHPGDGGFVVDFADEAFTITKPTTDVKQIVEGLKWVARDVGRGSTALYDALCSVRFGPEAANREKVFLVVSDFEDNSSRKSKEKMLEAMRKEGVKLFVLLRIPAKDGRAKYPEHDQKLATEATEKTGGEVFMVTSENDIEEAFRRLAGDVQGSYVLTYEMLAQDSKRKKVELQTSRGSVKLSYPK